MAGSSACSVRTDYFGLSHAEASDYLENIGIQKTGDGGRNTRGKDLAEYVAKVYASESVSRSARVESTVAGLNATLAARDDKILAVLHELKDQFSTVIDILRRS